MQIFEGALRFGIHSGQQHSDYEAYRDLWRQAEALGLDWASVFDHFQPIQSNPLGPCFEGPTLLAALAAQTTRLRCGLLVLGVTYRHPAVVANIAATLDHISGGRLELGFGAAWAVDEHEQYGLPFPRIGERMDMLDETLSVVRALWSVPRATFAGSHYRLDDALCEPKPIQRPLPIWVGGSGERRLLRIVATHADGWNMFAMPEDQYRHKLDVLARHCESVGRDPKDIRKQLVWRTVLGETAAEAEDGLRSQAGAQGHDPDSFRAGMVVGTPDDLVDAIKPFVRLGVRDHLILARPPADERTLELFAGQVAPALRAEFEG